MKKKTAFFIRSLHVGGAEKQSIYLTKELSKDYDIVLIVFYKEGDFLKHTKTDEEIFYFLEGNFFSKLFKLYKYLRKNKVEMLYNFLPMNNIIGTIVGKLAGVRYIFNGIRVARKSSFLKTKLQLFLSNYLAYGLISNSYKGKEAYSSFGFKTEKITVIHNLISDLPSRLERNSSEMVSLLTVGRFVDQKDYPTLLKVAKQLKEKTKETHHKWELNIVGYGHMEEEIKALASQYDLLSHVRFSSGKSRLQPYFEAADIYISTSVFEGMPNAIMEAMSYSLPVVATNAGDSDVLVSDHKNGYLCEIKNIDQICDKLLKLIDDEKERAHFGANSYSIIKNNFSPERIGNEYRKLIDSL